MLVKDSNILTSKSGRSEASGICPNDVQDGDKVVLVAGLAVLLIVRDNGSTVDLLDPVIVLGTMEGQAWPCRILVEDDARLEGIRSREGDVAFCNLGSSCAHPKMCPKSGSAREARF